MLSPATLTPSSQQTLLSLTTIVFCPSCGFSPLQRRVATVQNRVATLQNGVAASKSANFGKKKPQRGGNKLDLVWNQPIITIGQEDDRSERESDAWSIALCEAAMADSKWR